MNKKNKVTILGSGAYGTAIAHALSFNNDLDIVLYGISKKEINDINKKHINSTYSNVKLKNNISATLDIKEAIMDSQFIMIALPTKVVQKTLIEYVIPNLENSVYFINLSKGFDYVTVKSITETLEDIVPKKFVKGISKVSGPSFAKEMMLNENTSLVIASKNDAVNEVVSDLFYKSNFIHIEKSLDLQGVEYASIYKNVLSILLGIADGLGLGKNSTAILFVNSLREIEELGKFINISESTIRGYAGLGDLFLTGTSTKSRNYSLGYKIGKENGISKNLLKTLSTVEGVQSPVFLEGIAKNNKIILPLNSIIYDIIHLKKDPKKRIEQYFNSL